jgi:hypothetical protein
MSRTQLATFGMSVAMAVGAVAFVGCDDDPDTPGEAVDRAADKAERATDKAADKIEDAGDKAKDAVKDATD